jgi:hypothetical protein
MTSAKQVKDAAMVAGFREDEALQFSRDYLTSMYEASHRTASG